MKFLCHLLRLRCEALTCGRRVLTAIALAAIPLATSGAAHDRAGSTARTPVVSALLLSDVHFDPFQDPQKVERLAREPISSWSRILNEPPSADQGSAFAKVQDKCGKDSFDTSASLLKATSAAVAEHEKSVTFAVLTGDLIAHNFFCRYEAALPAQSHEEAQAFLEKTIVYVIDTLRQALRTKPLYVTFGNNDSTCGDYQRNLHDPLFSLIEHSIAAAARRPSRDLSSEGYRAGGHFTAVLPPPIQNTKIVLLDDVPLSKRFHDCSGGKDTAHGQTDLNWLGAELESASRHHQHVWLASHIPPGVDPRPTLLGKTFAARTHPQCSCRPTRFRSCS